MLSFQLRPPKSLRFLLRCFNLLHIDYFQVFWIPNKVFWKEELAIFLIIFHFWDQRIKLNVLKIGKVVILYKKRLSWNLSAQVKNPQVLPNPYETWGKYTTHEVIIFPKFQRNWAKIVDFLLGHSDFRITILIKLQL